MAFMENMGYFVPPGQKMQRGSWIHERTLGQGGFGVVDLWLNEESHDYLAVKRIRLKSELTEKHRDRWKMEVAIMLRLDQINVVRALPLPDELNPKQGDLPMMAMEFCCGGDLRKVLNRPENCCGLPENQVRALLSDVAAGLEYLHKNRIVHRDLKPDNIVLQQVEEKIVYKIIDLGYAKDLDQGSVCTSFVGTLQYLAPELLLSQRYTCTVDYWSLGITAFECMAGYRPFLPHLQPIQCHTYIAQKKSNDICIHSDMNSKTIFSHTIPPPCHLTRTTKEHFEHWLRLMLLFDAKERGGANSKGLRPKCFSMLQEILDTKMVHVLRVRTNDMVTFPISNKHTMEDLKSALYQKFNIPVAEQELLLASGISPDPSKPAVQCCAEVTDEEEALVFLFSKTEQAGFSQLKTVHMPPRVAFIVNDPTSVLQYQHQKRAWAQAVYMCQDLNREYQRLLQAQRAAMLSLLRNNSQFVKLKGRLGIEREQLRARLEFFHQSLDIDLENHMNQLKNGGVGSEKMLKYWQKTKQDTKKYEEFVADLGDLNAQCDAMSTKITELNRSPYCRSKTQDVLSDSKKHAVSLYEDLVKLPKENRNTMVDNRKMVECVIHCVSKREKNMPDLAMHIRKVCGCISELSSLIINLNKQLDKIARTTQNLKLLQRKRQENVWHVVSLAVQRSQHTHSTAGHPLGSRAMPTLQSPSSSPVVTPHESTERSPVVLPTMPESPVGLQALEHSAQESLHIMNVSQLTRHRLRTMLSGFRDSPLDQVDWGFLVNPLDLRWTQTDKSMLI